MFSIVGQGSYGTVVKKGDKVFKVGKLSTLYNEYCICTYIRQKMVELIDKEIYSFEILLPSWDDRNARGTRGLVSFIRNTLPGITLDELIIGKMPYKPMSLWTMLKTYDYDLSSIFITLRGVMDGIAYLNNHCRVVHRDLSPPNIMLDAELKYENTVQVYRPYIIDFGCAFICDTNLYENMSAYTYDKDEFTTPMVAAPELQMCSKPNYTYTYEPLDRMCLIDSWSVGVLCDLMLQKFYGGKDTVLRWQNNDDWDQFYSDYFAAKTMAKTRAKDGHLEGFVTEMMDCFLTLDPDKRATVGDYIMKDQNKPHSHG